MADEHQTVPRIGMFCMIRNRPAVILDVRQFDGRAGREYLVNVSYNDNYSPVREQLLWNTEPHSQLLEPAALPDPSHELMALNEFDAIVQSCRWNAGRPYIAMECAADLREAMASPFYGAIEPDDYQLVPLLKALRMPRVNLMIADDVGLGKTIEAGLIINELLIRRQVNRVLILCPASLSYQWRDEMRDKFSLPFEIIDRNTTAQLRNSVGLDVNPWRYHNRVIASYHYLRQELILEQFNSALNSEKRDGNALPPWDLLVVDEVHNLMPAASGQDSDLCRMLRAIVSKFEHKIFLTATPHNGSTRSFTGLLEILDPARFRQTSEMQEKEKQRVEQIVIRRLKRDINARTTPSKFSERQAPQELNLDDSFSHAERQLNHAVEKLKDALRVEIARAGSTHGNVAGNFALEVLGKRLLSCPMTFIDSWKRCKDGMNLQECSVAATDGEMIAIKRRLDGEITDDLEARELNNGAAGKVGEWLRPFKSVLSEQIEAVDSAIAALGIDMSQPLDAQKPASDARITQLCKLIDEKLRDGKSWRNDERLVVFTEYKTTQDYLLRQLSARYNDKSTERIAILYGGMKDAEREDVKRRFNDSASAVRILLATDAASEGLNLQETARYLLHFDCPWNPSRLEQRNGRLDRHGQSRDVYTYHFFSANDSALRFFSNLIHKIDTIRDELGAVAEVFDKAVQQHLIAGDDERNVLFALDNDLAKLHGRCANDGDADADCGRDAEEAAARVKRLAEELDLDNDSRYNVLSCAMRGQLTEVDAQQQFRIHSYSALNADWRDAIDQARRPEDDKRALPALTFSIEPFMQECAGRRVYRSRQDLVMLHLGHPLMRRAMNAMTRRRYPGSGAISRLTAVYGAVPEGYEAIVRLHLEEMAVNKLREAFHYWVHTFSFGVHKETSALEPLAHRSARQLRRPAGSRRVDECDIERVMDLYTEVRDDLRAFIQARCDALNAQLRQQLALDHEIRKKEAQERFRQREGELSDLIMKRSFERRKNEINTFMAEKQSLEEDFFSGDHDVIMRRQELDAKIAALTQANKDAEAHYNELREQLKAERDRIITQLLPRRYELDGQLQLFPIAVEIVVRSAN